ncbi:MAG: LTA synthase family protein [Gammaproteobacteria bacterium]|nr:LTA synthase family protein [Gammaproteobacteria bacterium]
MIGFWLRLAALWMALGLALRLAMAWLTPAGSFVAPSIGDWLQTFLFGVLSDAQAGALICGWLGAGFLLGRRLAVWWIGLTMTAVALVMVGELLYWMTFFARAGIVVVRYIRHPLEVLAFLHEMVGFAFLLVPLAAAGWAAARWMSGWLPPAFSGGDRRGFLALLALTAVLVASDGGYRGPTTPERSLNHLASNGWLEMLHAASFDQSQWEDAYWQPERPELPSLPASPVAPSPVAPSPVAPSPVPQAPVAPPPAEFKHLLLVIEESFGGQAWWNSELRRKYAPQLAAIAPKGIHFDRVYATGAHTLRGMEAILHGYPPLPGLATPQRDGVERLPSLPRVLAGAGFHTAFVYGGWPDFTNFFDYWRRIGFDAMLSRYDFPDPWFETSWGVADEILLDRVLVEMDRRTERHGRVMLCTLTVTNHHPFDFPAGRVPFPNDRRRQDYALAYADWALGKFVREAQRRPWFEDTLLVIVADHGPLRPGPTLVPANNFRVPLVFYNPARLAPQAMAATGSTMSLPVTLLDLLGVASTERFYGRSLLSGEDQLAPAEEDYHIGVLGRRHLTVLARGGGLLGWRYDGESLMLDEPDMAQARQAAALFGDAQRRFHGDRNKP